MSRVSPPTEDDPDQLFHECAQVGMLPLVSPCPNGCRFCYERQMHRLYPRVQVPRVPPPTGERLERFWADVAASSEPQPVQAGTSFSVKNGAVQYYNWSDFFSQGFGLEDIERLLRHNAAFRFQTWVHTNAHDLTTEWARQLSARFPETLRLHLSVTTLDEELKRTLVAGWNDTARLLEIIGIARHAKLYLIHVNAEQTLSDLRLIDRHANRDAPPVVVIARLHHHRLHPADIQELSLRAGAEERRAVELLVAHRAELTNIEDVFLFFPSACYAWTARAFLRGRLRPSALGPSDLVLCSEGAYDILRRFVVEGGARVVAVADPIGGSTDFTTTLTTAGIIAAAREQLASGPPLRRLFVPSSIWWVEDRCCLEGGTLDDLRAALPELEVNVVSFPLPWRRRRLTLTEAYDFLRVDLDRTADLYADAVRWAELLRACCGPLEEVTAAGYIRRVVANVQGRKAAEIEALVRQWPREAWAWSDDRSEIVLDARRLAELPSNERGEIPLTVRYLEPVVATADERKAHESRRIEVGGATVRVRRDCAFETRLEDADEARSLALALAAGDGWDLEAARARLGFAAATPAVDEQAEHLLGLAEILRHRCGHVERDARRP